jgi:pyrroline-5-carboxylate reductase
MSQAGALEGLRIGFLGGGAMAEALAGGILAAGVGADRIFVSDVSPERRARCARARRARTSESNAEVAGESDVCVLAVKPKDVAAALASALPGVDPARPLWISIAAGVRLASLEAQLGSGARAVRAMPNTPALVRCGATGLCANARADARDRAIARALFESVGLVWEAPEERLLDAVTGLSGSGPAYVFLFLEALAAAGEAVGLPGEASRALACQTVLGAARLAAESGRPAAELRRQVTSPGGTTERGVAALEAGGFARAVREAVAAATERSRELGG